MTSRGFQSAAKRPPLSSRELRAKWRFFIDCARTVAAAELGTSFTPAREGRASGIEHLNDLGHAQRDIARLSFPSDGESAAIVGEALGKVARIFTLAAPRRREILAPVLESLGRAADAILDDDANAAADIWKRRQGIDD